MLKCYRLISGHRIYEGKGHRYFYGEEQKDEKGNTKYFLLKIWQPDLAK